MDYIKELRAKIGHSPVILVGCVGIIANCNGEILLQKRQESRKRWGLPGGLMELGESVEETVRREISEETGLTVENVRLFDVFSGKAFHVIADNGDEFYSVTCAFICSTFEGKPNNDQEETICLDYYALDHPPENMVASHRMILDSYRKAIKKP